MKLFLTQFFHSPASLSYEGINTDLSSLFVNAFSSCFFSCNLSDIDFKFLQQGCSKEMVVAGRAG
jgi:hypothetical protein